MTATTGKSELLRIAVFTRERDFHAYMVRHVLESRGIACSIIETDALSINGGMNWWLSTDDQAAKVLDVEGKAVAIRALDALWWRRFTGEPRYPDTLRDDAARDLVARDCRATLIGLAITEFRGRWISHPEATRLAENKLIQLRAARAVGLRVPATIVSQDPESVRHFCEDRNYQVIVKTVAGTPKTPVMAGLVTPDMLDPDAVRLTPAIYQEYVPGTQHLRVCCFGDAIHSALLTTEQLDWRYPLNAAAERVPTEPALVRKLRDLLARLNLRMGIVDMKLAEDGEPVWLEINPQGQFLFLEGMCGMPLTNIFADFLLREAKQGSVQRRSAELSNLTHSTNTTATFSSANCEGGGSYVGRC